MRYCGAPKGPRLLTSVILGMLTAIFTFLTLDYMRGNDYLTPAMLPSIGDFQKLADRIQNVENVEKLVVTPISQQESRNVVEINADTLKEQVKVCVWVLTYPDNHDKKARVVKETWGTRATVLTFMSSLEDPTLPSIDLKIKEGRDSLWGKTKAAFKYQYEHFFDKCDWFMKSDDDTYVVMENLRYMLSLYDSEDPIWFGSRFKKFNPQGYMSGGGGYVLSKAALKLFVESALPNQKLCKPDNTGAEDAEMGKCLNNIGVMAGDSRDNSGKGRFFPFVPEHHLTPHLLGPKMWYWDYIYYPIKNGPDCCSETAVTFHYINPERMREMEYLIYHLKPFGMNKSPPYPPLLPPDLKSVPKKIVEDHLQKNSTSSETGSKI